MFLCGAKRRRKEKLVHGDRLIVWKLDRLGRSVADLLRMLDDFKQRGVKFRFADEPLMTGRTVGGRKSRGVSRVHERISAGV